MISKRCLTYALTFASLVAATVGLHGQLATIPEQLAREGRSLHSGASIPSGVAASIDDIVADTDAIVRGIVGEPRSYLSQDQTDVYTDYRLSNPVIAYQSKVLSSPRPGMPSVIVTLLGGTVTIDGLSFTSRHEALPELPLGAECLFLLKNTDDDHYRIAGTYYGVFAITGGRLTPLTRKHGFAPEYQGAIAEEGTQAMVSRLRRRVQP